MIAVICTNMIRHRTCPKTQQFLTSFSLTPKYVLRGLIAQWCEANGVEPPKKCLQPSKTTSACAPAERSKINSLLNKLTSGNLEDQRFAAGEIRLLAKRNAHNRVAIAEAGAIRYFLSVPDENKVTIGGFGAIPPLVTLLSEGNQRGKRAGIVPTLMKLLKEPNNGLLDESLAILSLLASHSGGRADIGAADALPVLVAVIGSGSPRNKENSAAVLVLLCSADQKHLAEAQKLGVMSSLVDLVQNGTNRGKLKAEQFLACFKQQNQA
ncbi:RING-type E3 ubiquitin transferase [Heracleum sosnowskyi]|uniref:RING-type E3 ubiquitin transferase n=1 Tax=Heracleum sosnowskyi TaxID=360622 RepID=A0AAD8H0A1_9APIA|nr:RING-type E3 ubiquitin transferase [Heracleum sosnowskyi]